MHLQHKTHIYENAGAEANESIIKCMYWVMVRLMGHIHLLDHSLGGVCALCIDVMCSCPNSISEPHSFLHFLFHPYIYPFAAIMTFFKFYSSDISFDILLLRKSIRRHLCLWEGLEQEQKKNFAGNCELIGVFNKLTDAISILRHEHKR